MTNPDFARSHPVEYQEITDGFALTSFFQHVPRKSVILPAHARTKVDQYPTLLTIVDAVQAQIDTINNFYPDRIDSMKVSPHHVQNLGRLATTSLRELKTDGATHALTALQDCAHFFTNDLIHALRDEGLLGLTVANITALKTTADSRTLPQMALATLAALRNENTGLAENSALRIPERFAPSAQQLVESPALLHYISPKTRELPLHAETASNAFVEGAIAGLAIFAATAERLQTNV